MITHEEARESHKRLFESYLDGDWAPFPTRSDLDTYRVYIAQQEKKDKLLDLYRALHILWLDGTVPTFSERNKITREIQALEEELK